MVIVKKLVVLELDLITTMLQEAQGSGIFKKVPWKIAKFYN